MDRLTKEAHPQKTLSYSYDASGNRQSMTEGSSTTSYTYDKAERMTRAGSETFSYDNNGNLTSRTGGSSTTNYAYDSRNHLIKAGEKTYQRDALGRVVSSTEGSTKTDYLFDGSEVLQETTGGESVNYTRGLADRLISRRQGTSPPSYYHHDAIGSVVGLSGSAGTLTDTYAYDAFGNELSRTGSSTQPYAYVGNRHDPKTNLSDFHARSYDPSAGRFTSKDPVRGFKTKPQTMNPYSYGVNGPLAHPDPYGRCVGPFIEFAPLCVAGAEAAFEAAADYFGDEEEAPSTGGEGAGGEFSADEGDSAEQPPLPGMGDDEDLPVYTVNSKGNQPNIEANDRYAIEELGAPDTLTRTEDPNVINANREAACGDFEGEGECDEYPYASTHEEAANPNYPYSAADVPPEENSSQGGELNAFYNQYNLGEGDRYRVKLPEEE